MARELKKLIEKKKQFEKQLEEKDPITGKYYANTLSGELYQNNINTWFDKEVTALANG